MDTYATSSNKRTNHSLMLIHSYLSWAIAFPATTGLPHCLVFYLYIQLDYMMWQQQTGPPKQVCLFVWPFNLFIQLKCKLQQ